LTGKLLLAGSPRQRLENFYDYLSASEVDLAVICNWKNVYYFTAYLSYKPRLPLFLILDSASRSSTLFLAESEKGYASRIFPCNISSYRNYDLQERMVTYPDFVSSQLEGELHQHVQALKRRQLRVGVEDWDISKGYLDAVSRACGTPPQLIDLSKQILSMRKTKGRDEVELHRKAARKIDFSYMVASKAIKADIREADVYAAINCAVAKKFGPFENLEPHLVTGDYVSGARTLGMGGPPTERKIKTGETLILDLQACEKGYWADTARTFVVGKRPLDKQKKLFRALLNAKRAGEEILKPGTKCGEIYRLVSKQISLAGYGDHLPHHAGHGLGLDDQEPPFFIPASQEKLEEGVVCALEPGIYNRESGGMRIEDNYVITKDGFEKLSKFPLRI
jgi:Xaa-Pro dipeptidase